MQFLQIVKMETNNLNELKGVSYFGVRSIEHVLKDMQCIKAAGFNAVLHTFSEEDLQYYFETMQQIVVQTANLGLKVYVNPWGVGRVFGGEAYSELTARNHDMCQIAKDGNPKVAACVNNPEFRKFMHTWINAACSMNIDFVFWDEPHFYFEKGNLQNWSCRCACCKDLYRKRFNSEMPLEFTDKVKIFREESLINFLDEMTCDVHNRGKKNCVCMLPPWFSAGLDNWDNVARLKNVDEISCDPYWERGATEKWIQETYSETAKKLMQIATKFGKKTQMWIKAYQIEAGREHDLAIAVNETIKAGIKNIFAWSYCGTKNLSFLKSDNPDEVARVFRKALSLD